MRLSSRHPESRLGGRLWHRPRGPQLTSYLKSLGGRPELRNHGVGWMRAVERLRNGGVPPNSVFLMPATHSKCSTVKGGCFSVRPILNLNVVSPVPTKCHQLSPHISCAGCAITNHSELSRMSHLRKSPLYRRQGWPRPGGHNHQSRPQERRLNTGSRLYRAMLAPAAAPPGRPRVFPQAVRED